MVKGTPREWVDEILRVGPTNWVPPLQRHVELDIDRFSHVRVDAYRALLAHHTEETDMLHAVIRELVGRLQDS